MKKTKEILKLTEALIKHIGSKEGFGRDKCKGYNPDCANCQGQILLGSLEGYKDLLEWELDDKR